MSFPYLDLPGFSRRTIMPQGDLAYIENDSPGFTAQRISNQSSWINGRLRKRYGNSRVSMPLLNGWPVCDYPGNYCEYGPPVVPITYTPQRINSLPLGRVPPPLLGAGTTSPRLHLVGCPVLGSLQMLITITTPGITGVAVFTWSPDNGITNHTGILSSLTPVVLTGTGMSIVFPTTAPYTFSSDNIYAAPTPVPEIVLSWLTVLVTYDLYRKRGLNPQDPTAEMLIADVQRVYDEVKEAADSKDGLFDLPVNEDEDSAITTGGPTGYSEVSPYVWQDIEEHEGRAQDSQFLTYFGGRDG